MLWSSAHLLDQRNTLIAMYILLVVFPLSYGVSTGYPFQDNGRGSGAGFEGSSNWIEKGRSLEMSGA
ncbi:MAG TPA: hypothetical protein PKA63_11960 [Oligoflexia bacterium]|nr:hypothetical protein [Oligoflexia bacterium]HMP49369.1 hypothetical protein [Oligoflexia bacterium]